MNVALFACIYTMLSYVPGHGPTGLDGSLLTRFANSLYYSTITATNTGYGDIVPIGYSRFFAALQSFVELFLFALFVSKLVSSRQDVALQEMHKLSFELTFRNIREDFFIARKDFDLIIRIAQEKKTLSEEDDWRRLTVAYQHITSLLHEIPNFYNISSDLYVIDPRREALLLDAVQRTTARINQVLTTMNQAGINWLAHRKSTEELQDILVTLDSLSPLWQNHSLDQSHDAFLSITDSQEILRAFLKQ